VWAETWGVRNIDADHEANVIWAMVHGITSLALAGRLPFTDQQQVFALFDLAASRWVSGMLNMQAIQTEKNIRKTTKSRKHATTKRLPATQARRTVV